MDPNLERNPRVLWSFWISCGLLATGAIAPVLLAGGDPSRIYGGSISFGIAAVAMAANALSYPRGTPLAIGLYAVAWITVVYGILRMVAVPLQLALMGTCAAQVGCPPEFARAFSGGEGVGIGVGIATGALALQVGLFGIRILYRRDRQVVAPPPVRTFSPPPPIAATHEIAPPPPSSAAGHVDTTAGATAAAPDPAPAATSRPARKPRTKRAAQPVPELPPPSEPAELPAHPEPPELPPHSETA